MTIGDAASLSGLPIKTIRYYEEIGLVNPARSAQGYRDFADRDVHDLRFLARSRSLGFSIEDCRTLLALYRDRGRSSADVKAVAKEHIARVKRKIAELESMRDTLETLVSRCHGDARPDCPILEDLGGLVEQTE